MKLAEINRTIWFSRLKAECILVISLAVKVRRVSLENIDEHIANLEKLATAAANAKRALLYFKNSQAAPVAPPTEASRKDD